MKIFRTVNVNHINHPFFFFVICECLTTNVIGQCLDVTKCHRSSIQQSLNLFPQKSLYFVHLAMLPQLRPNYSKTSFRVQKMTGSCKTYKDENNFCLNYWNHIPLSCSWLYCFLYVWFFFLYIIIELTRNYQRFCKLMHS